MKETKKGQYAIFLRICQYIYRNGKYSHLMLSIKEFLICFCINLIGTAGPGSRVTHRTTLS